MARPLQPRTAPDSVPMGPSTASGSGRSGSGGGISTLADLTACVGCSLTLVGDHIYVFGGRLVPTRTMVSTLYSLSLRTLTWTLLSPLPGSSSTVPAPRYFHSAEAWGSKIVIFGGEGYGPEDGVDGAPLCTLGDVCIWDTVKSEWTFPEIVCVEGVEAPAPRYAHLAVVQTFVDEAKGGADSSVMVVIGGQDVRNTCKYILVRSALLADSDSDLHSVNVLDLDSLKWVRVGKWDKHIGTYRAVATSGKYSVNPGGPIPSSETSLPSVAKSPPRPSPARPRGDSHSSVSGVRDSTGSSRLSTSSRMSSSSRPATPSAATSLSTTFEEDGGPISWDEGNDGLGLGKGEGLVQLSYSERPTTERPEPLIIFSNFNFTAVRRDLDVLTAPAPPSHNLDATSLSSFMAGPSLPPGLRFPTGTIIGRHLLIFGTFLSQTVNNFSLWALDLGKDGGRGALEQAQEGQTLDWMRVDPGSVLSKGSWNRAVGWKNSVVVLGDRDRDIATDYDHRQTNFTHVAFVDLECFGIYQPPPQALPPLAQSFGLLTLSQPFLADFEIICADGKRLGCSRKLLDDRWTWFRQQMDDFKDRSKGILAVQQRRLDGRESDAGIKVEEETSIPPRSSTKSSSDLRLTPRTLNLPEPSPIVEAFLQYIYTLTLCTPLQLSLPVLTGLLVFSKTYEDPSLRAVVVHALHETLAVIPTAATAVYEASMLGGCTALQIRALKQIMYPRPQFVKSKVDVPVELGRQQAVISS